MTKKSNAREMASYSFLVVFANDDTISAGELGMLERLALDDGVVYDDERSVLRDIFERANYEHLTPEVTAEIARFRRQYGI